jgi:uncharacterized protein (DUF2141 family)
MAIPARNAECAPALARTSHARLCRVMLVLSLASAPAVGHAADLEVEVRGVRPHGGDVRAAVFDRAEDFALDIEVRAMVSSTGEISAGVFTDEDNLPRPPARLVSLAADARTLRIAFPDLEPGEYAVGVYQDRNGNRRLDTTVVRDATEPWGISNDPRPKDRGPTWDEAKFTLPPEGTKIVIELR